MTTSTYSPGFLQSPYAQTGVLGQQGIPGFDQWTPQGNSGVEQIMPTVQFITHQLVAAQQCVWTAQYLLNQLLPQIPQAQFSQFGQLSPQFGQFGPQGQRQLPRQYPMAW